MPGVGGNAGPPGTGATSNNPPPPPPLPGATARRESQPRATAPTTPGKGPVQQQPRGDAQMPLESSRAAYATKLPQPQPPIGRRWSERGPPPAAMGAGPLSNNSDDASFGAFLRFVASDLWKTCHSDNRYQMSPERTGYPGYQGVRRGGA